MFEKTKEKSFFRLEDEKTKMYNVLKGKCSVTITGKHINDK